MATAIELYKDKKIVEYLNEKPEKVLIVFYHGLGDLIMFLPLYNQIKDIYPNIEFSLATEKVTAFHEYFRAIPMPTIYDYTKTDYDFVFIIRFAMSEAENITKTELCAINEFGIEPIEYNYKIKEYCPSPLVGVHFQGTCLPFSTNPTKEVIQQIWQEIEECGYIPIETHFVHYYANPINEKNNIITNNVRGTKPEIWKLIGLIKRCNAFIGVASGPFIVALATIPEKTFYLEGMHKLQSYTKKNIPKANIYDYKGEVKQWLTKFIKQH